MKALLPRLVRGNLLVVGVMIIIESSRTNTVADGFLLIVGAAIVVFSQLI